MKSEELVRSRTAVADARESSACLTALEQDAEDGNVRIEDLWQLVEEQGKVCESPGGFRRAREEGQRAVVQINLQNYDLRRLLIREEWHRMV